MLSLGFRGLGFRADRSRSCYKDAIFEHRITVVIVDMKLPYKHQIVLGYPLGSSCVTVRY